MLIKGSTLTVSEGAGYCHDVTESESRPVTRCPAVTGSPVSSVATQPFETSQIDETEDNSQLLTETDCSLSTVTCVIATESQGSIISKH